MDPERLRIAPEVHDPAPGAPWQAGIAGNDLEPSPHKVEQPPGIGQDLRHRVSHPKPAVFRLIRQPLSYVFNARGPLGVAVPGFLGLGGLCSQVFPIQVKGPALRADPGNALIQTRTGFGTGGPGVAAAPVPAPGSARSAVNCR